GAGADSELQLVAVEPAALTSADSGAMPPACIRVGEPLALRAMLAHVAHPIRERCEVARIDSHVVPQARYCGLEGRGETVETVRERIGMRPQLDGEAVAGPNARAAAESALQAGVILDQRRSSRPSRESV